MQQISNTESFTAPGFLAKARLDMICAVTR
jgi:hypothetical protein